MHWFWLPTNFEYAVNWLFDWLGGRIHIYLKKSALCLNNRVKCENHINSKAHI